MADSLDDKSLIRDTKVLLAALAVSMVKKERKERFPRSFVCVEAE